MITLITNLASAPLKASGVGTRGEDRFPPLADLRAGYQVINEQIAGVLGDADLDIRQGALDLASEIMRKRSAETVQKSNALLTLSRLANATGCPPGTPIIPWLESLGLAERNGDTYAVTPKAGLRVVGKDDPP